MKRWTLVLRQRTITSLFYLPEAIYRTVLLSAKAYEHHNDMACAHACGNG
jgi:hypothetical protein